MGPDFSYELKEYQYILFHTREGLPGREYLKQRNISPDIAKFWGLGYSPKEYNPQCYEQLYKENITLFWRKLNGRLIIPIYNVHNQLISLSGRALFNQFPKYDMYPFPSKKTLFGLNLCKDYIRQENCVFITEGQIDVISSWQHNFKNIVSTFGAHSSNDHLSLLARYTDKIYVIYDADRAGLRGMERFKHLKQIDLTINCYPHIFNQGEDLDNWIQHHSKEELYYKINNYQRLQIENKLKYIENRPIITI